MNFSSTSIIRKSIKTRYLVGIAGVALALSVMGGLTELGNNQKASVTAPEAAFLSQSAVTNPVASPYFDAPLSAVVGETREGYGPIALADDSDRFGFGLWDTTYTERSIEALRESAVPQEVEFPPELWSTIILPVDQ